MPFFSRSGHQVVTVDQFLAFVDPFFHQEATIDPLGLLGRISWRWLGRKGLPIFFFEK